MNIHLRNCLIYSAIALAFFAFAIYRTYKRQSLPNIIENAENLSIK